MAALSVGRKIIVLVPPDFPDVHIEKPFFFFVTDPPGKQAMLEFPWQTF